MSWQRSVNPVDALGNGPLAKLVRAGTTDDFISVIIEPSPDTVSSSTQIGDKVTYFLGGNSTNEFKYDVRTVMSGNVSPGGYVMSVQAETLSS
ncbi:hypothetical protein AF97_24220 [Salmonella enterica]|nr:hypothetical protein [Salmonella enterica]ECY4645527.1 hypothetical protein [Salmonella enterica subsp. enterica serovar Eastbourne]EDU9493654.1 hypothetical protein [Salmonella enterica subsp. enterica]EGI6200453.1 hypothetical protein [Salmonella enterica subsp. enterica serovar Eastbourne]EIN0011699.1 hypothetical protein [Salmonella enterica]